MQVHSQMHWSLLSQATAIPILTSCLHNDQSQELHYITLSSSRMCMLTSQLNSKY